MNVEVVLLRALAGQMSLQLGSVIPGRVLDRNALLLAGMRVPATLPENLVPGTPLSLRVREASAERLVLQVVERPEPGTPAAAAALPASALSPPVTLPGGAAARLLVDPDGGEEGGARGGRRRHSVTLRYESPRLGRVDLALTVAPGAVSAVAHAPEGDVADRLRESSGDLRDALAQAVGLPASVSVVGHGETLDVRA